MIHTSYFLFLDIKRNLIKNMKIQTKEKAHECNICKKRFKELNILKIHERIHLGEKSHLCKESNFSVKHVQNVLHQEAI